MDYRLVTDWTHPGLTLDFFFAIPFLILGIFLIVKSRYADSDKDFLFGSAVVNGLIVIAISTVAFAYTLTDAILKREKTHSFLNQNQIAINGSISALNESALGEISSLEISDKKYSLYNPIPKFRVDGQLQLMIHQQAKILFVKSNSGNLIVKMEVENLE